jgi:hypothetical protein
LNRSAPFLADCPGSVLGTDRPKLSVTGAYGGHLLGRRAGSLLSVCHDEALGVHKWGSGPSVAFLKKDESPWVWGVVVNNVWSIGGPPQSSDKTNSFLLNPFFSYHFSDGWSVGSSPNITANWLSRGGQQWTLPIGGGIDKILRLGEQRIKLSVDSCYNAIRPQAGNQNWLVQSPCCSLTISQKNSLNFSGKRKKE